MFTRPAGIPDEDIVKTLVERWGIGRRDDLSLAPAQLVWLPASVIIANSQIAHDGAYVGGS